MRLLARLFPLLSVLLLPAVHGGWLEDGDRVAFLGDAFMEREQLHGYVETLLTAAHAGRDVRFCNLGWSGDTPQGRSRASFGWHRPPEEWFEQIRGALVQWRPTVVVVGYGMASSFDGPEGVERFGRDYRRLLERIRESLPEAPPRFLLVGPVRHESLEPPLPDPEEHNRHLELYDQAVAGIAREEGLPYIGPYRELAGGEALTGNGIHLGPYGYYRLAGLLGRSVGLPMDRSVALDSRGGSRLSFEVDEPALPLPRRDPEGAAFPRPVDRRTVAVEGLPEGEWRLEIDGEAAASAPAARWARGVEIGQGPAFGEAETLRRLVVEKNRLFFHRYRPQNHTYLFGFRRHEQGSNAAEIPAFDPLIEEREEAILEAARPRSRIYRLAPGGTPGPEAPRRSPSSPPEAGEEESFEPQPLPSFQLAPELEISLWASNPLLHKPIHMNFDARGRLWVASSSVYPQIRPGELARDTIVVLEDRDRDGFAERSTTFADGLLIPTGVAPGDGGAYVAQSTELLHFRDLDGDGRADQRRIVLSGFGTEDTHHMLHSLRWGLDGRLYMNQSIYIHSHIETPHGVRRLDSGGIWRLQPASLELEVFLRGLCNPWGHDIDRFGQSFATDGAGSSGINFGVPGAMYFTYARAARTLDGISPGHYPKYCGLEILHSSHFPEEWQGMALTCDFRAHRIVPFRIGEEGSGYAAQEGDEWVRGEGSSFRPVDLKTGPDGALYVADWSNPIIQHGEVDFRDPRRDKVHGRIWRIVHRDRPLAERPEIEGAPEEALLGLLLSPDRFASRQAARQLAERGPGILPALRRWAGQQESEKALLQALWLRQALDRPDQALLERLLEARDGRVRAAAARVLGCWQQQLEGSLEALSELLADPHPRVRLEALRALARNPSPQAVPLQLQAADHPMDRFLDYALWLGLHERGGEWIGAVLEGRWSPEGRERQLDHALRAVPAPQAALALDRLLPPGGIGEEGPWIGIVGRAGSSRHLGLLLEGLLEGSLGPEAGQRALQALEEAHRLRKAAPPEGAAARIVDLFQDPDLQAGALRLAGSWKVSGLEDRLAAFLADPDCPPRAQEAAVEALRRLGSEPAAEQLRRLLQRTAGLSQRPAIAEALASMDLARSLDAILGAMDPGIGSARLQGIWEAMLRQKDAEELIREALGDRVLSPEAAEAGLRAARSSGRGLGGLQLALERAGGLVPPAGEASQQRVRDLARRASSEGDPDRGEAVYRRPELGCVLCHSIGGVGGRVGPDLTSIGASAPMDYLSESLLLPNEKIKEGYHSLVVETVSGLEHSGVLQSETPEELALLNAANQLVKVPAADIAGRRPGLSLMPSGLIEALPPRDQADLLRFLSQLGRPGRFDASRASVARRWSLLPGRHTEEQFGLEGVVRNPGARQWRQAATLVDGRLTREAMARALQLPSVHQATSLVGLFAWSRLHLARAEEVILSLQSPGDARLWIGGREQAVAPSIRIGLEAGIHDIVLRLDPRSLPGSIRLEASAGTFPAD